MVVQAFSNSTGTSYPDVPAFYNKIHLMKKEVVVIAVILLIVIIIAVYMFFVYGIREGMEMAPRVSPST